MNEFKNMIIFESLLNRFSQIDKKGYNFSVNTRLNTVQEL